MTSTAKQPTAGTVEGRRDGGFTLIETVIVLVVSVPILFAILSTSENVGRAVDTTERVADAGETVRTVTERVSRLVRSAHWSTFQVQATLEDVLAGRALVVGEWITAPERDPRSHVRFRSVAPDLTTIAGSLTTPRELEFVLDKGETDNDADDDGDGLVDEGQLFLLYESTRVPIAEGVEAFSIELDVRVVRFSLQCATRDRSRRVHRVAAQRVWWVRNQ